MLTSGGFALALKYIMRYFFPTSVAALTPLTDCFWYQIADFEKLGEVLLKVCKEISDMHRL
jgi:hypothetical protein